MSTARLRWSHWKVAFLRSVSIEAKTWFLWMTMAVSMKVGGVLDQWLNDNIPWTRAQHGLKGFKFQTDRGEFSSEAYKDLVVSHGANSSPTVPTHPRRCP